MSSVASAAVRRHRNSLDDVRPEMAKAQLKKIELDGFREQIGQSIQRAISIAGRSQKEVAGLIGCDVAQIARWIAGTERPQFDRLFAVEELRWPLIQALAALAEAEIYTEIRRRA
jgi:ribosome-binding protein aMBF1 (putative translation factor)